MYLLTGYRICCVVGGSKYGKYAFAPSALHLQHPVSRYNMGIAVIPGKILWINFT